MSPDKVLNKIQLQIKDLAPLLEQFVEETIQPTVGECEELQSQLAKLQENLVVYRFVRENRELSPSFNLHAKVSEKEMPAAPPVAALHEEKVTEALPVKTELKEAIVESIKNEPTTSNKIIQLGINDRFRTINELFLRNTAEFNIAIEQLNTLLTWHEAEIYLNSLKSIYDWKDGLDITKLFYAAVKKRFD